MTILLAKPLALQYYVVVMNMHKFTSEKQQSSCVFPIRNVWLTVLQKTVFPWKMNLKAGLMDLPE